MSLDINVYCKEISADLIPDIVKRLNDFGMTVEIHPEFKFDQYTDSGFLPFKFRLHDPPLEILKNKDLIGGFEIYIDDFELEEIKRKLKPKQSTFNKLLRQRQPDIDFAPSEIEEQLNECKKVVTFVWHSANTFDVRFTLLTSAILAELTSGFCCYPSDNIWHDQQTVVENAFKDVIEYEKSLNAEEIKYYEFEKW